MNIINNKNEWQCKICGNYSTDSEEFERSFETHLKEEHNLNIEKYNTIINDSAVGLNKMKVKLLSCSTNPELALISFINQTWGPLTNLDSFSEEEIDIMINNILDGSTLSTALETINFTFQIEGITRACSHQLVRVRIGSGFSQKGMRDVNYKNFEYVIPPTVAAIGLTNEYIEFMKLASDFYEKLFEEGVPYQDARFVVPHAATTSLAWTVNLLALSNFCSKRLQNHMQWEINALARMIRKEIQTKYPIISKILKPRCEVVGKCLNFSNLSKGCGKFKKEFTENNKIFLLEQMTKKIKFDNNSVENMKFNNQKIKKGTEKYWCIQMKI